jgi:hypothetical protein
MRLTASVLIPSSRYTDLYIPPFPVSITSEFGDGSLVLPEPHLPSTCPAIVPYKWQIAPIQVPLAPGRVPVWIARQHQDTRLAPLPVSR